MGGEQLADERHSGKNFGELSSMMPSTPVSFVIIVASIFVFVYNTLQAGCGIASTQCIQEYNWTVGDHFDLTEEMLRCSVGCGVIAEYFTAYPNEYYDQFGYSAGMVPTRLFSWCLGHATFDALRMNMLFMLFLGPQLEDLVGPWQMLHMFLVTALTGGIYTLCFANGAMLGSESLVYALIALLFLDLKAKTGEEVESKTKVPFTQVLGCLLFVGIQGRVLYTEYSRDLEDGVSQTGHIVSGMVGVTSWWCIHNRRTVMNWADVSLAETLRNELASRRKKQAEKDAREEKRLRQELEPEVRRLFRDVDIDGNEVLDHEEVLELAENLGISHVSKLAVDDVMQEILDPKGEKELDPDEMLVDFDEFFDWYVKQHQQSGDGFEGLKRKFDFAKGRRDKEKQHEQSQRELDDAQEAFEVVCESRARSRKALKDLTAKLRLNLSTEVTKDVLYEMDGRTTDFRDFEKWWRSNAGGGGARAVTDGKLREYFVELRQKMKKNNQLRGDSDEDGALHKKTMYREARTLFKEYVDTTRHDSMKRAILEKLLRDLGLDPSDRKLDDAMEDMTEDPKGRPTESQFVDWWVDSAEELHKVFRARDRGSDSEIDEDHGLFGSDDDARSARSGGSARKRIQSKYQRKFGGSPRKESKKEMKFTFKVEPNQRLFDGLDHIVTVKAADLDALKSKLKYDLRIRTETDVDVYYYDEAFMRDVKPRDLDDLFHASKGVCPKGGHKIAIQVVDHRYGLRRDSETDDNRSDSSTLSRRIRDDFGSDRERGSPRERSPRSSPRDDHSDRGRDRDRSSRRSRSRSRSQDRDRDRDRGRDSRRGSTSSRDDRGRARSRSRSRSRDRESRSRSRRGSYSDSDRDRDRDGERSRDRDRDRDRDSVSMANSTAFKRF